MCANVCAREHLEKPDIVTPLAYEAITSKLADVLAHASAVGVRFDVLQKVQ